MLGALRYRGVARGPKDNLALGFPVEGSCWRGSQACWLVGWRLQAHGSYGGQLPGSGSDVLSYG